MGRFAAVVVQPPRLLVALLILLTGLLAPAQGQTLVAIDALDGTLYTIDSQSGATVARGTIGPPWNLWTSMAKDSQGRIYAANGAYFTTYGIYEIDPVAVTATFVSQTNLNAIAAMAFGPGDVLYAVHDTTAPLAGGPDDLYTIDLATGATTRIGPTGMRSIAALEYGRGEFWSWDIWERGLVNIDPATGWATDVNPHMNDVGLGLCQTLCFSENEVLYGGYGTLAIVDPVTGVPAHIGLIASGTALINGLEFLPNQPDPFALWVIGKTGGPMAVQIAGATPGANVAILAANGGGGPISVPGGYPCAGLQVDLNGSTRLLGLVHADAQGCASLGPFSVPAGARNLTRLQAVDATACATSNRIVIKY